MRVAIVTAGGAGLSPWAPGTFGSLVGIALIFLMPAGANYLWFCLGAAAIATAACVALGKAAERDFNDKDPQSFVLDEVAGMLVAALSTTKPELHWLVASFALFRFFDIKKPLGIARTQRFPGGVGIVADDLAAGAAALVVVQAARFASTYL